MVQSRLSETLEETIANLMGDPDIVQRCAAGDSRIQGHINSSTPRVFIISGPSGVGKDTILERLQSLLPSARYVVTATTREQRDGEIDGIHYHFLEEFDFRRKLEAGYFLEHAEVYGKGLYGVPRHPIEEGLAQGQHVIVKVDVQGVETLMTRISHTVKIFLMPESMEALLIRLIYRNTESPEAALTRFRTASEEIEQIGMFDYVVINESEKQGVALDNIHAIIHAEQHRIGQVPVVIS